MSSLKRVALLGATGMVGQGVLRHLLQESDIDQVWAIGRTHAPAVHAKLTQITRSDLAHLEGLESIFAQVDAVIFCLGVSAFGLTEDAYRAINCDTTLSAARLLHETNPKARFVYVSAKGADSSMQSGIMWARVRGHLEHTLQGLSPTYCMVRPGVIVPMDGIQSRTTSYRIGYTLLGPCLLWLHRHFPKNITTTQELARVLVHLARVGHQTPVIESDEFASLGRLATA